MRDPQKEKKEIPLFDPFQRVKPQTTVRQDPLLYQIMMQEQNSMHTEEKNNTDPDHHDDDQAGE